MRHGCGRRIRGYPGFESGPPCDTGRVKGRTSRTGVVVTGREAEVFDLVGEHLTHDEIGQRLFISPRTVESHVASLRRKLGMIDHRSLVRLAVESRSQPPTRALPQEASSFLGRSAELREVIDAVMGLRVSAEDEREGLDFTEHGGNAYPDFEVFNYSKGTSAFGAPSAGGAAATALNTAENPVG